MIVKCYEAVYQITITLFIQLSWILRLSLPNCLYWWTICLIGFWNIQHLDNSCLGYNNSWSFKSLHLILPHCKRKISKSFGYLNLEKWLWLSQFQILLQILIFNFFCICLRFKLHFFRCSTSNNCWYKKTGLEVQICISI